MYNYVIWYVQAKVKNPVMHRTAPVTTGVGYRNPVLR